MPFRSAIPTFIAGLPDALDQGVGETADQVKATRDTLVHVVTGALLASGRVVQVLLGFWQVREGDGLPDARATIEEYGDAKRPAHPHMTPAAMQHAADLPRNVARHLKDLERRSKI